MRNILIIFIAVFILNISFPYGEIYGQADSSKWDHSNIIKINLISLPPLFNKLNQKWLGLEYQRLLNKKLSLALSSDFGVFEDYTYIKYYDFFDEDHGFSYTQEDIFISGFHIIPSINYYPLNFGGKAGQGLFIAGKIDYYHYKMNKQYYNSLTNQTDHSHNTTDRLNIGVAAGAQYIIIRRISIDLNISFFTKIISYSDSETLTELYPENSFWRSNDNSSWATINLMLGYSFGANKSKKVK